jgi:hypothetical protein
MLKMKSSVETIMRSCRSYGEDEKLCKGYDEDDSSVEAMMRMIAMMMLKTA